MRGLHLLIFLDLQRVHVFLQQHYRPIGHTQGIQVSWKPVFPRLLIQFLALGLTVLSSELGYPGIGGSQSHSYPPTCHACCSISHSSLRMDGWGKSRTWVQVPGIRGQSFPCQGSNFIHFILWYWRKALESFNLLHLICFQDFAKGHKKQSVDFLSHTGDPRLKAVVAGISCPSRGWTIWVVSSSWPLEKHHPKCWETFIPNTCFPSLFFLSSSRWLLREWYLEMLYQYVMIIRQHLLLLPWERLCFQEKWIRLQLG